MSNLEKWENIIKEKRKKTDFRVFLKEIASWNPIILHRNNWIISRFPETERINITSISDYTKNRESLYWKWNQYIFENNFFSNFQKLLKEVKMPSLIQLNVENSDFADTTYSSKNCYLCFSWFNSENSLYTYEPWDAKNILNSVFVNNNSENVYMSTWISNWSNVFFSKFISNSHNIYFSSNLIWCQECIFCDNLVNQSYHILNKKLEKDEYFRLKTLILKEKEKFLWYYEKLNKKWLNFWSTKSNWSFIIESENIENWYFCTLLKNWRNLVITWKKSWNDNFFDVINSWWWWWNDFYWVLWVWWSQNIYSSISIAKCSNMYYCYNCNDCSFCIWCIWIQNKQFCILNKQYSKEQWYELADKIFSQMNDEWILWNFFPGSLNPFYFNDTMAYLIDQSFTKDEVEKQWYLWREEEIKVDIPDGAEVVYVRPPLTPPYQGGEQIPPLDKGRLGGVLSDYQGYDSNWNWFINPEILKKVIKDENWNVYKIVKMEYDFLMKYSLPLPEIHWLDRIKMWFSF